MYDERLYKKSERHNFPIPSGGMSTSGPSGMAGPILTEKQAELIGNGVLLVLMFGCLVWLGLKLAGVVG